MTPTPKTPPIVRHIIPREVAAPPEVIAIALCLDYVWGKAGTKELREQPKPVALLSLWLTYEECYMDLAFALGKDKTDGITMELVEGTCDDTFQCPKVECYAKDRRFSTHVAEAMTWLMTSPGTRGMWKVIEGYLEEAVRWHVGTGGKPTEVPRGSFVVDKVGRA